MAADADEGQELKQYSMRNKADRLARASTIAERARAIANELAVHPKVCLKRLTVDVNYRCWEGGERLTGDVNYR
jgi:hypothetical protein